MASAHMFYADDNDEQARVEKVDTLRPQGVSYYRKTTESFCLVIPLMLLIQARRNQSSMNGHIRLAWRTTDALVG